MWPPASKYGRQLTRAGRWRWPTPCSTSSARPPAGAGPDGAGPPLPAPRQARVPQPGGSVKDRPAVAMIEAAEREGAAAGRHDRRADVGQHRRRPGDRGGPARLPVHLRHARQDGPGEDATAAGLRRRGGRLPDGGARPSTPSPTTRSPTASTEEIPGAFQPDQYRNPRTRPPTSGRPGPEIWRQTAGRVTHFVAGIGTGGTISGVGRYLKAQNPDVQIIGADPEGSVYSGGGGRPYLVEGIGEDFWPDDLRPERGRPGRSRCATRDSFLTARRRDPRGGDPRRRLGGHGGLGRARGRPRARPRRRWSSCSSPTRAAATCPRSTTTSGWPTTASCERRARPWPTSSARKGARPAAAGPRPPGRDRAGGDRAHARSTTSRSSRSSRPSRRSPAEVVGSVNDRALLERALRRPGGPRPAGGEVMGPPLPTVGSGRDDGPGRRPAWRSSPAVLVLDSGHPVGVLTRSDLLAFLAQPVDGQ